MSHDIRFDLRCARKQDLSSDRVTLGVLDAWQVASGVAYAVEHNLGVVAEEGVVQMLNLATEESNTEAL